MTNLRESPRAADPKRSKVEHFEQESRYLRGKIAEELTSDSGHFPEADFRLHGITKSELTATIIDVNATLLRTLGACGADVRNITSSPGRPSRRLASLAPILSPCQAATDSPCQAATERRCSK